MEAEKLAWIWDEKKKNTYKDCGDVVDRLDLDWACDRDFGSGRFWTFLDYKNKKNDNKRIKLIIQKDKIKIKN